MNQLYVHLPNGTSAALAIPLISSEYGWGIFSAKGPYQWWQVQ